VLDPVTRPLVARRGVRADLRSHLRRSARPGDRLPAERELALQLGVNRNALREALKRLEQLRLVAIHPGGSTRVLDFPALVGPRSARRAAVLRQRRLRLEAARSLVELRTALGPDIAARAARAADRPRPTSSRARSTPCARCP